MEDSASAAHRNTHSSSRALSYPDGIFNGAFKDMEVFTVDLADTVMNTLTELRTRLIHGQENARNLQSWSEPSLYRMDHIQNFRDALAGEEMCLNRDDAMI